MSPEKYTEDQVKIILEGVENDVDYEDIARQAGVVGGKRRITDFLEYRMIKQFHEAKSNNVMELSE